MIHAEVTSTEALTDLDQMVERLDRPRTALEVLGDLFEDYERDVFATRGRGQWAGLDPATAKLKNSGRVLVDTGNLLRELTRAHIDSESVYVDAGDAHYAKYLRDGARGMPKRDPAPEPPAATVAAWADELLAFLVDGTQ